MIKTPHMSMQVPSFLTNSNALGKSTGKRAFFTLLFMCLFAVSFAQLKPKAKCPDFYVDILNGTVNGLKPNQTISEIKDQFPCATSTEEDGTTAKCGSGVLYKDRDIYFYTHRQYIEIGPRFKGKLSIPLMGAKRNSLFSTLGNPKMKDDNWDAYEMQYGTLVLHYDAASKVKLIQFSTRSTEVLELCE
jgi:hypothetical protein